MPALPKTRCDREWPKRPSVAVIWPGGLRRSATKPAGRLTPLRLRFGRLTPLRLKSRRLGEDFLDNPAGLDASDPLIQPLVAEAEFGVFDAQAV